MYFSSLGTKQNCSEGGGVYCCGAEEEEYIWIKDQFSVLEDVFPEAFNQCNMVNLCAAGVSWEFGGR